MRECAILAASTRLEKNLSKKPIDYSVCREQNRGSQG